MSGGGTGPSDRISRNLAPGTKLLFGTIPCLGNIVRDYYARFVHIIGGSGVYSSPPVFRFVSKDTGFMVEAKLDSRLDWDDVADVRRAIDVIISHRDPKIAYSAFDYLVKETSRIEDLLNLEYVLFFDTLQAAAAGIPLSGNSSLTFSLKPEDIEKLIIDPEKKFSRIEAPASKWADQYSGSKLVLRSDSNEGIYTITDRLVSSMNGVIDYAKIVDRSLE